MIAIASVSATAGLLLLIASSLGLWLMMTRPSEPWIAQVVSVDDTQVCTVSFEGEIDGGFVATSIEPRSMSSRPTRSPTGI